MKRIWRRGAVLGALAAALLVGWAGGEDAKGGKLPADLAHVPTKAMAMWSVRPAELWASDAVKTVREKMGKEAKGLGNAIAEQFGVHPEKIERLTFVFPDERSENSPLIFIGTTEKFDAKAVFSRLVVDGKEMKAGEKAYTANKKTAVAALGDRAFVFGRPDHVRMVLTDTMDGKSGLAPAVRLAAEKHFLVAGVNPKAFPPPPDDLPPQIAQFKPLLKASVATATLDLNKSLSLRLHATFPDADTAASGLKAVEEARKLGLGFLNQGLKVLSKDKSDEAILVLATALRDGLKEGRLKREAGGVQGEMQVKIDIAQASVALKNAVVKVRQAAQRVQMQNNFKQIGLAFHNYASAYNGKFPAQGIYSKDGKPLLSWRVTILPYVEQQELYNQFKLNEAWDSPHNKKLLAKMPKLYEIPGAKNTQPGYTFYQGFSGKGTIFDGKRSADLNTDFALKGTSNTLLIVEAGKAVPWTKPEDIPFDPAKKLPKLGIVSKGGFQVLLADGSVRFVSDKVSEKTLKTVISLTSKEKPGDDW